MSRFPFSFYTISIFIYDKRRTVNRKKKNTQLNYHFALSFQADCDDRARCRYSGSLLIRHSLSHNSIESVSTVQKRLILHFSFKTHTHTHESYAHSFHRNSAPKKCAASSLFVSSSAVRALKAYCKSFPSKRATIPTSAWDDIPLSHLNTQTQTQF